MDTWLQRNTPTYLQKDIQLNFIALYKKHFSGYFNSEQVVSYEKFLITSLQNKNKETLTFIDFLNVLQDFFSKGSYFFTKEKHLNSLSELDKKDANLFKEYIKFRFYLGYSFKFNIDQTINSVHYQSKEPLISLSYISNEKLTIEETLNFLETHNVCSKKYALINNFNSKEQKNSLIRKMLAENSAAIFPYITQLLQRNEQILTNLHSKVLLNLFHKQHLYLKIVATTSTTHNQG